jgi:hypothetical protein
MIRLFDYDPRAFQTLSTFFAARDELARFRPLIREFGDLIRAYQLENHISLCLLHKHFDIADDELVLREFCDNTAYMRPKKVCEATNSIPYLWKIWTGTSGKGYYPLEFVDLPDQFRVRGIEEIEVVRTSTELLSDFAAKLEELQLVEVFGIAASCSRLPFVIEEGMSLVETSDEENRLLTLQPSPSSVARADPDSIQTLWLFNNQGGNPRGFLKADCVSHCISHCHGHCVKHRRPITSFIQGATP